MKIKLLFDNMPIEVEVDDKCWKLAKQVITDTATATGLRECCVVSQLALATGLRDSTFKCGFRPPKHADHDVIFELGKDLTTVDIKVLFANTDLVKSGASPEALLEGIIKEIDGAVLKETKQGNICCFDLSFIGDECRYGARTKILSDYPECIILEYDLTGSELHLLWPEKNLEAHKGNWDSWKLLGKIGRVIVNSGQNVVDLATLPPAAKDIIKGVAAMNRKINAESVLTEVTGANIYYFVWSTVEPRDAHGNSMLYLSVDGRTTCTYMMQSDLINTRMPSKAAMFWLGYVRETKSRVGIKTMAEWHVAGTNATTRLLYDYMRDVFLWTTNHYRSYLLIVDSGTLVRAAFVT